MPIQNLENLPLANKLSLLEQITNSSLKDEEEYVAPAWHAQVLQARKVELEKPEEWLSLEELLDKCDLSAPTVKDLADWEAMSPAGKEQ